MHGRLRHTRRVRSRRHIVHCLPRCGDDAAADQRGRDALTAEVAMAVNADLFVTERPYLFETRWPVAQGVTLCPIPKAL